MYATCPKCGYKHPAEEAGAERCSACGLVYRKWLKQIASEPEAAAPVTAQSGANWLRGLAASLVPARPALGKAELVGYGLVWIALAIWGIDFVRMDYQSAEVMRSWFHNVDLIIHEAGHIVFMPFGRFMMYLGGSLFQVLLPLMLMLAFLVMNKDAFGASVCLWWVGQSLMDIAPYIADARALRLPLLGGGTGYDSPGRHDWANILGQLGMVDKSAQVAATVDFIGSGVLLMALVWGAVALYLYYRRAIN